MRQPVSIRGAVCASLLALSGLLHMPTSASAQLFGAPKNVVVRVVYAGQGTMAAGCAAGSPAVGNAGPSDEDVGKAVLKTLGALALHQGSIAQRDDGLGESLLRAVARKGRDELVESALQDVFPRTRAVERAALRSLVVLALEGRLDRDRDRILARLRQVNPDGANAVEISEFLIRLVQAVDQSRQR